MTRTNLLILKQQFRSKFIKIVFTIDPKNRAIHYRPAEIQQGTFLIF